jgi:hypothetical protein
MDRIHLPVDSDLAWCSVRWAAQLLGETPQILWVTPEDDDLARRLFGDIEIGISECLPRFGWELVGATRSIYSDGA